MSEENTIKPWDRGDSMESQDAEDASSGMFSPIDTRKCKTDSDFDSEDQREGSKVSLKRQSNVTEDGVSSRSTQVNDDNEGGDEKSDMTYEKGGYEDEDDFSGGYSDDDEDDDYLPAEDDMLESEKMLQEAEGDIEDNAKALAQDDPNRPQSPPIPLLKPGKVIDVQSLTPWDEQAVPAVADSEKEHFNALELGGYGHNVNRAWVLQGAYQGLLEMGLQEKTSVPVTCFHQDNVTEEPGYPAGINEPRGFIPDDCDFPRSQWPILRFDAGFESGNLGQADLVCHRSSDFRRNTFDLLKRYGIGAVYHQEYDCWMRPDVNSKGNTQWFYFSVKGAMKGQTVRFNIANNSKDDSLFNYGMRPVGFSLQESETNGVGWHRVGTNITYFRGIETSTITPSGKKQKRQHYVASFEYTFQHEDDTVYFAYGRPYPYSRLCKLLRALSSDESIRRFFRCRSLCKTLAGNHCHLATITAPTTSAEELRQRRAVIISARIHPGEACASWIMEGVLRFLTSQHPVARLLRERLIFKIIPMLNPDGVIVGNYRCNLSGQDLNRQWYKPSALRHPTICAIKDTIRQVHLDRKIVAFVDLHGHSKRFNTFVYGCTHAVAASNRPQYRLRPRALAHLLHQHAEVLYSNHVQNYRKKFWSNQDPDSSDDETSVCTSWDDGQWKRFLSDVAGPWASVDTLSPLPKSAIAELPRLYRIALRLPAKNKAVALLSSATTRDWAAPCLRLRESSDALSSSARREYRSSNTDEETEYHHFPCVSDTVGKPGFRFEDCRFVVQQNKKSTGRVCAWRDLQIEASFTLEASFMGTGDNKKMDARVRESKYGKYGTVPVSLQELPLDREGTSDNFENIKHFPPEEACTSSDPQGEESEEEESPMLEQLGAGSRTMAEAWYRLRRALDTVYSETGKNRIIAARQETSEYANAGDAEEDCDFVAHPLSWLCPSFRSDKGLENPIAVPRKSSLDGPGGKYPKHYTATDLIAQGESLCFSLLRYCSLSGSALEAFFDIDVAQEVDWSHPDSQSSSAENKSTSSCQSSDCIVLESPGRDELFPPPCKDPSMCPSAFAFQQTLSSNLKDVGPVNGKIWKGPPKVKRSEFVGPSGLYPPLRALDDGGVLFSELIHEMAQQLSKRAGNNPSRTADNVGSVELVQHSVPCNGDVDDEALGLLNMLPADSDSSAGSDSDPSGDNLDEGELKETNLFRKIISKRKREESKRRKSQRTQKSVKQKPPQAKPPSNKGSRSSRKTRNKRSPLSKSKSFTFSNHKPATHSARRGRASSRGAVEVLNDESDASSKFSTRQADDDFRVQQTQSRSTTFGDYVENSMTNGGLRNVGSPLKRNPFRDGTLEGCKDDATRDTPPRVPGRFRRPISGKSNEVLFDNFAPTNSSFSRTLAYTSTDDNAGTLARCSSPVKGESSRERLTGSVSSQRSIVYFQSSSCSDMYASNSNGNAQQRKPSLRKNSRRHKASFPGLSIWSFSSKESEASNISASKPAFSPHSVARPVQTASAITRQRALATEAYGNSLYPPSNATDSEFLPNVQPFSRQGLSPLNPRPPSEDGEDESMAINTRTKTDNMSPAPVSPVQSSGGEVTRRSSPPLPSVRRGVSESFVSSRHLLLR
eukprot:gb/GECG01012481.1/.p1 GENE.gb/GECG01012481.1/~~gb/GECG01012481.1/.p1  ORF type:complete len:1617 (+),score=188.20 gb/GECG01012481.1/:1-4851(+)